MKGKIMKYLKAILITIVLMELVTSYFIWVTRTGTEPVEEPTHIITVVNDLDYTITGNIYRIGCKIPKADGTFLLYQTCPKATFEMKPNTQRSYDLSGAAEYSVEIPGKPGTFHLVFFSTSAYDKPEFTHQIVLNFLPGETLEHTVYASEGLETAEEAEERIRNEADNIKRFNS
jgi:hypothetical protein